MREIIKNIQLPIDGTVMDFRLTKLDAFTGATLLQTLAKLSFSGEDPDASLSALFTALPPAELRCLMTTCLNHTEVLLPAGYQPVMQGSAWAWPELEHDASACLKLTLEEALWTLSGFFSGGGPTSRPAAPDSIPSVPRT